MKFVLILLCLFSTFAKRPKTRDEFFPKQAAHSAAATRAYEIQRLTAMKSEHDAAESAHFLEREAEASRMEQCQLTGGVLLQTTDLPASGRRNGDPCDQSAQCASNLCICKHWGGMECSKYEHDALDLSFQSWASTFAVTGGTTLADIRAAVHDPTGAYCKKSMTSFASFSDQQTCGGPNGNIGYKMELFWTQDCTKDAWFRIGFDWGNGGAIVLDDVIKTLVVQDIPNNWWGGSWSSASGVSTIHASITPGSHTLQFYGFEPCCDGGASIQYSTDGTTWQAVDNNFSLGPCVV